MVNDMYDENRLKGEYINYVTRLIYNIKHRNVFPVYDYKRQYEEGKLTTADYFKIFNLFTVQEFLDLVKGVNIDKIDFYDEFLGINPKKEKTDGTKLSVYSYSHLGRCIELSSKDKYMRYSLSTINERHSYINISQITDEGIYAFCDKEARFISIDNLRNEYENRNISISFEEFLESVAGFHMFDAKGSLSRYFVKIELPSDCELLTENLEKYNEVYRMGLKEYFVSKGYKAVFDSNYDNKAINDESFYDIRDDISSFVR